MLDTSTTAEGTHVEIEAWLAALKARPGRPPSRARVRQLRHDVLLAARTADSCRPGNGVATEERALDRFLYASGYPSSARTRILAAWRGYESWRSPRSLDDALLTPRGRPLSYMDQDVELMFERAVDVGPMGSPHATLDIALIAMLVGTGLQLAEIMALGVEDVDTPTRRLIAGNVPARRRCIQYSEAVGAALERYLASRTAHPEGTAGASLIATASGAPFRHGAVRARTHRLAAGLRPTLRGVNRARAFRHTYAFQAVAEGVELEELTRRLGAPRSDVRRYYTTFVPALAVDLDALLHAALDRLPPVS